jgi:putative flippase GtrA
VFGLTAAAAIGLPILAQFEFMRFGMVGVFGMIAFYAIYTPCVLVKREWYHGWASLAFVLLLGVSFMLHKHWTFNNLSGEEANAQLLSFVVQRTLFQGIIMFALQTLVTGAMPVIRKQIFQKRMHPLPAQILIHVTLAVPSYLLTKWIFHF